MGQIKRLVAKKFWLPLMCLIVLFMMFSPNTLHWRPTSTDHELLKMLQSLQRSQIQNNIHFIKIVNNSSLYNSQENPPNSNNTKTDEYLQRKATRKLFDQRPGANASLMAASTHPLFTGYIIENAGLCSDEGVDVLVYLQSSLEHRDSRRVIREAWGSFRTFMDINVKLVFFLGRPNDNLTQYYIETEFSTYGDIVQGDFLDTFRNLTYKAITMLTWVNSHCSNARYIVKVDDDMFVDIYRVISELVPKLATQKLAVACDVKTDMPIPRDPHGKWYVSENLLPGRKTWPKFCSGYFAIFTGEVVPALYEASFGIDKFIPIDDAYLFGLLVERNISLEFINIHGQISPIERPDPAAEIKTNGKFAFISFRVKSHNDHTELWTLRSKKLSPWEQVHSNYFRAFQNSEERKVLLV